MHKQTSFKLQAVVEITRQSKSCTVKGLWGSKGHGETFKCRWHVFDKPLDSCHFAHSE